MYVQLDEELWEMADSARLEEVLARISDAAHTKGRLVTSLLVGESLYTDRDLLPAVLAQPAGTFGKVVARSQSIQAVLSSSAGSANEFGASLKTDGEKLVGNLRQGEVLFRQVDDWLGRLADYVEWLEMARAVRVSEIPRESISTWLSEVLEAREREDTVRLADVLEYEVLPRLPFTNS